MPIAKVPTIEDFPRLHTLEVDIDRFLNRYIPQPPWHILPRPISHFLGYRLHPPKKVGNVLVMFWSLVGIFTGLLIVTAVSTHIPSFKQHDAPIILGSFVSRDTLRLTTWGPCRKCWNMCPDNIHRVQQQC